MTTTGFPNNSFVTVPNALFGAWIGNVAETFNEVDEGRGFVIVGLGHN